MKLILNLQKFLRGGLWLCLTAGALADPAPAPLSVAVYPFGGKAEAVRHKFREKVTVLLTADLTTETNIIVLERAELNKELNEQAFGVSGLVSSDAAARIGAMTGAKVLVSGEVIVTGHDHLIIVADIIGTETGRLFAIKDEGEMDNLVELTADLSAKIARTIAEHATNLAATAPETSTARVERIVKSVTGANRPSVSVNIFWPSGEQRHATTAETEFGAILIKAGFTVVDANSDRKADVEIEGLEDHSEGPRKGQLFSNRAVIELKVQNRRTGEFITMDREESFASSSTRVGADRAAQVQAVDGLAERVLPLLAK